jgi:DNA polymerase (family X)
MPKEKKINRIEADLVIRKIETLIKGPKCLQVCGSYRRNEKLMHDLDILVYVPEENHDIFERSVHAMAKKVLVSGHRSIRILTDNDIQIDFMIVQKLAFESAMLYLTGSKLFNIKCRQLAKARGFKLNEYGLWKGGVKVAKTELGILESIGMAKFYEPRLRSF